MRIELSDAQRDAIRVPKTAEIVAGYVRERIVRGDLRDGDALPSEGVLMTEFGISRPTLREAFRILEAEALITVRRGARGGARVHPPSHEVASRYAALILQHRGATVGDLLEARVLLETPVPRLLAARDDRVAAVAPLEELLAETERRLDQPAQVVALHAAFHRQVVAIAGNPVLTLLTDMLEGVHECAGWSYRQRRDPRAADRNSRQALRDHAELVSLVKTGCGDGATALWHRHLLEVTRLVAGAEADQRTVLDVLDR